MNKFYPPIDIIEIADSGGYKYIFMDADGNWYATKEDIIFNKPRQVFIAGDQLHTEFRKCYLGQDNDRSTFHHSESIFSVSEWALKNRQEPDEPSITLTLDEAREMIDAITKSVEGLFPGMTYENMWIGSPFKKLATFVDAHEEED